MKKSGTTIINRDFREIASLSELFSSFSSIGVVCNDAGSAEVISEIVCSLIGLHDFKFHVAGPASAIFLDKGLAAHSIPLDQVVNGTDVVLTGTGWQTNIESESRLLAKNASKPCYVVLDHWQDFRIRFRDKEGSYLLPDTILVTNLLAFHLAQKQIPEARVIQIPDLYVESLLKQLTFTHKLEDDVSHRALYLSDGQPYSSESPYSQSIQIQKLADHKHEVESYAQVSLDEIWIRPHPSDVTNDSPPGRIGEISIAIQEGHILNQIINAPLIVGTDSMAMYVAMRLGRRVLTLVEESARPEWLDFCPTITQLSKTEIDKALVGGVLTDASNQFYLRGFSILDIDNLHLEKTNEGVWLEDTDTPLDRLSFEIQINELRQFRAEGNHCLAIISSYHQRIGLVTLRLNKADGSLIVRMHYYNESDIDELSQRVWEKVTEFLLLHFKNLKNPSNLPTSNKKMERVFRRVKD